MERLLPTGPDPPALDPEAEKVDMIESEGMREIIIVNGNIDYHETKIKSIVIIIIGECKHTLQKPKLKINSRSY